MATIKRRLEAKRSKQSSLLLFSILSVSVILSGCGSEKKLYPPKSVTLGEAQREYEHLPKPIKHQEASTLEQKREFDAYLKRTFDEIEAYRRKLGNVQTRKVGKNRPPKKPTQEYKVKTDTDDKIMQYLQ